MNISKTVELSNDTNNTEALLIPPGHTAIIRTTESHAAYVKQTFKADDLPALEGYLARMVTKPVELGIYIDPQARVITAILDHTANADSPNSNSHQATLQMSFSPDFAPLNAVLGKALPQEEFINFLEENAHLFVEAAKIQEMVATFQSTTFVKFKSVRNNTNGTASLAYSTEEDADQTTKLPTQISAVMPIYAFQDDVTLKMQLRYRTTSSGLQLTLICPGIDKIIRGEVLQLENRLRVFIAMQHEQKKELGWDNVLLVRGKVDATKLTPEALQEFKGGTLPPGLTAMSTVAAAPSGRGY